MAKSLNVSSFRKLLFPFFYGDTETLAETIESDPLYITDLFQNKSVAYILTQNRILSKNFQTF